MNQFAWLKHYFSSVLTVVVLLSQTATAAMQSTTKTAIVPSESGDLFIIGSTEKIEVQAEKSIEVSLDRPILAQLSGRVPMILVPVNAGKSELRLNPPTIADATGAQSQREMSNILSNLLIEINEVQRKVQEKRWQQAYDQLVNLQKKYPKIAYLDFIKASILYLQGKRSEARTAIESALKAHPNFQEGKDFLKQIGGKSE